MRKYLLGTSVVTCLILLLQNCGSMSGMSLGYSSSSISSIYPYTNQAPKYFADVQVVDKQKISEEGLNPNYSYRLIATAVSTTDEDSDIEVEIIISDASETPICPRVITVVNRANNHIQIDNCISTDDTNSLIVKVFAGTVGGVVEEVRTQMFDLSLF